VPGRPLVIAIVVTMLVLGNDTSRKQSFLFVHMGAEKVYDIFNLIHLFIMKKIVLTANAFVFLLLLSSCAYQDDQQDDVTSYEECVEMGYDVTDGACTTPDGRTFHSQEPAEVDVRLEVPAPHTVITNTVEITGEARGTWYFEGIFSILLLDDDGETVAQTNAEAEGEWMTEDWVPFEAAITIPSDTLSQSGTLVLQKANPSGLPQNEEEVHIPILIGESARTQAGEGEFCGGIAGLLCGEGLHCELEGSYPDAGGVCVVDSE